MPKIEKQLQKLRPHEREKVHFIMQKLNGGVPYRDVGGQKLCMPTSRDLFISFRLQYRTRAIVRMDRTGKVNPLFVGSHGDYDKLVGPKAKTRLRGVFS